MRASATLRFLLLRSKFYRDINVPWSGKAGFSIFRSCVLYCRANSGPCTCYVSLYIEPDPPPGKRLLAIRVMLDGWNGVNIKPSKRHLC